LKEADFASWFERYLDLKGYTWVHFERAQYANGRHSTPFRGAKGFPDYIAFKKDRVIAVELKASGKKPAPEQFVWLMGLGQKVESYWFAPEEIDEIKKSI
jgi:hypothetical protein